MRKEQGHYPQAEGIALLYMAETVQRKDLCKYGGRDVQDC